MDTLFRHEESEVLRGFCHSEEWACRCAAEGHMAADAAGAKALVGVIKIIKGHHYDKTREPPWRAMEKRHPPLLVAPPPPSPKGKHVTGFSVVCDSLQHGYHRLTGFSGRLGSPTNPVRWSDSSSFATPASLVGLWVLSIVLHTSTGKHREVLFSP